MSFHHPCQKRPEPAGEGGERQVFAIAIICGLKQHLGKPRYDSNISRPSTRVVFIVLSCRIHQNHTSETWTDADNLTLNISSFPSVGLETKVTTHASRGIFCLAKGMTG